jgi:hypothetical protein
MREKASRDAAHIGVSADHLEAGTHAPGAHLKRIDSDPQIVKPASVGHCQPNASQGGAPLGAFEVTGRIHVSHYCQRPKLVKATSLPRRLPRVYAGFWRQLRRRSPPVASRRFS